MEDIGLKACPFCGGLAVSRSYYNSYVGRRYFIECTYCGATSGHRPTEIYAVGNWNGRTEVEESK